jgi:hypothetical protein
MPGDDMETKAPCDLAVDAIREYPDAARHYAETRAEAAEKAGEEEEARKWRLASTLLLSDE